MSPWGSPLCLREHQSRIDWVWPRTRRLRRVSGIPEVSGRAGLQLPTFPTSCRKCPGYQGLCVWGHTRHSLPKKYRSTIKLNIEMGSQARVETDNILWEFPWSSATSPPEAPFLLLLTIVRHISHRSVSMETWMCFSLACMCWWVHSHESIFYWLFSSLNRLLKTRKNGSRLQLYLLIWFRILFCSKEKMCIYYVKNVKSFLALQLIFYPLNGSRVSDCKCLALDLDIYE